MVLIVLFSVFGLLLVQPAAQSEPVDALRVTSFNIRLSAVDDGPNHWKLRKEALLKAIRSADPDLLGTQETCLDQRDFLIEQLPDYAAVAAGRDDGKDAGEMTAVFYRRDRFELLASGHFWLSETPEAPGSKNWDAAITRMATWLRLRDLRSPNAQPIFVINTHFDHVGERARLESAKLLRRRVAELGEGCSVVVMGDFNCDEDSPPYAALMETPAGASKIVDTYRAVHRQRAVDEATFQAFKADATRGSRIDFIFAGEHLRAVDATIDRAKHDGRLPSDHFSVHAVLRRAE